MVGRVTSPGDLPAVHTRPTLADVARLAGVSAKTVSRVYSDPDTVSADTQAKVIEAADRLRFRPNVLARNLRRGGLMTTVGFVTAEFTNPFYIQVAAGMEREFGRCGYTMVLATSDDPAGERKVIDTLVSQRVGSVLFVPIGDDHSYLEGERRLGMSIVAIDRPARNLLADAVVLDNQHGAYLATRTLIEHGHRRIGYVCSPLHVHTQVERLAGYDAAMAEAGLPTDRALVRGSDVHGAALEPLIEGLLTQSEPPTAIVGGNNRATLAAVRVMQQRDLHPAFVGFDDLETADIFGISVIAHDPMEMGKVAAQRALLRLDDPTGVTERIVMPVRYVARGSGERPPLWP